MASLNYHVGRFHKDRYFFVENVAWFVDVYDFIDQVLNVVFATKYQKIRGLFGHIPSGIKSLDTNALSVKKHFLFLLL